MSAGLHGILGVSFHQAQVFQHIRHQAAYVEMHVHPLDIWTGFLDDEVVTSFDDAVDIALFLCELPTDRSDACIVGAIVVDCFGSCVAEKESSFFEWVRVAAFLSSSIIWVI